jgi:hypothetical protein
MNKFTKYTVIVATVALVGVSQARAMTVDYSANNTRFLTLNDNTTPVPVGDFVAIGLVTNTAYTLSLQNVSASAVLGSMVIYQTTTTGTLGTPNGGFDSGGSPSPGAGFFSLQAYIISVNSSNAASANSVGVFTNPGWIFPTSDGASAKAFDISDLGTTALIGALANGTVTDPAVTAYAGTSPVDAAALHNTVVPEPSSITLVGLSLLGLIGFARRRS